MKKSLIGFICCVTAVSFFAFPASAFKQKYTRHYQERTKYYQERTKYYQEKDFPNARAYLEVSRISPKTVVEYSPQEPTFEIVSDNLSCHEQEALSCSSFSADFSSEADCELSLITLKVTEKIKVSLTSSYKKGTCQFDRILKHELTHIDTYRKTLNTFIAQAKQELTEKYKTRQENRKGCEDIQKSVADLTNELNKRYSEKAQAENAKLDMENGNHKYNFSVCASPEKNNSNKNRKPDEVKTASNPLYPEKSKR
ncbi:MAG: hypothetical protein J5716_03245 [Alphaproteobacteria bacterium]|nr:hypothetical protein [Alphaproteobacteria bacterium]